MLWRLRRANLKAQHSSAVRSVCATARQNGAQTSRRFRERTLAARAPVPASACSRCLPIATSPGPSQPPADASVADSRAAGAVWACVAARAACSRGPRPGSREVSADVVTHRVLSLPQPRASSSLLSTASSASRCSAAGWKVKGRPAAKVRHQQAAYSQRSRVSTMRREQAHPPGWTSAATQTLMLLRRLGACRHRPSAARRPAHTLVVELMQTTGGPASLRGWRARLMRVHADTVSGCCNVAIFGPFLRRSSSDASSS